MWVWHGARWAMPSFAKGVASEKARRNSGHGYTPGGTASSKVTLYAATSDGEEQTRKIRFERVNYSIFAQSTQQIPTGKACARKSNDFACTPSFGNPHLTVIMQRASRCKM
jgi:hypothetical protein